MCTCLIEHISIHGLVTNEIKVNRLSEQTYVKGEVLIIMAAPGGVGQL